MINFCLFIIGLLIVGMTFKKYILTFHKTSWLDEYEEECKFVRRKPLKDNIYVNVDFDKLPVASDEECQVIYNKLIKYKDMPLLNLKDTTNKELKLTYGTGVIDEIAAGEKNYFDFMDILSQYGKILFDKGFIKQAQTALELSLEYGCDLSKALILLGDIYNKENNTTGIENLKSYIKINMKDSPFQNKILKHI